MLIYLIIAVLSACGLSILVVEKGNDYPIRFVVQPLRMLLEAVHEKTGGVFDCGVCFSFWAALLCDWLLYYVFTDQVYFLWPISGLVAVFVMWLVYEILNAFDPLMGEDSDEEVGI